MTLHPSIAAVRNAVRIEFVDTAGPVVVACSGGADSLALLSAAIFHGHKHDVRVVGVTVDHGLQEGSADHARHVVGQMASMGADETASARVTVETDGRGTEAAAREARYAVLGQMADHFASDTVLLGHTLDDQAETVLLGLARGSGARSLAGMRRSFDRYRRPLLGVTRVDTVTACQVEGLEFWEDPHNVDPSFTRSRVRHRVLPVLEEELGPGVAAALARTAHQLTQDSSALDRIAEATYADVRRPDGLSASDLEVHPAAIIGRVVRLAALDAGAIDSQLFHSHVVAVADLVHGDRAGKQVQLPGHVTAFWDADRIRFRPTAVEG